MDHRFNNSSLGGKTKERKEGKKESRNREGKWKGKNVREKKT